MTIKKYLASSKFKKEYKCWHYAHKIYGEDGKCLFNDDSFDWTDDAWVDEFLSNHEVCDVYMDWELGDDHELYAFAHITTCLCPGYMRIVPCSNCPDGGDSR